MQTLTGRLTADAKINELPDGRKVVNFSLAMNRRFRPKGSEAVKEVTTFVNCAFWLNTSIAPYLKKGTIVETSGFIGINAWTNAQGEAKASLTQYVSSMELFGKGSTTAGKEAIPVTAIAAEPVEDLPF